MLEICGQQTQHSKRAVVVVVVGLLYGPDFIEDPSLGLGACVCAVNVVLLLLLLYSRTYYNNFTGGLGKADLEVL